MFIYAILNVHTFQLLHVISSCIFVEYFASISECGSSIFEEFLNLIGDKVRLKGFDKYRGGLDCKSELPFLVNILMFFSYHVVIRVHLCQVIFFIFVNLMSVYFIM